MPLLSRSIDSRTRGDIVMIDGREAGVTPLVLQETLKAGAGTHDSSHAPRRTSGTGACQRIVS